ncbi:MAG TPA: hypothetical protein VFV67_35875 [Actinophytocola sp.]|uniref:hypothetical protein n=1 Tax=Actinophytocola sp. TaxID=1872138 RepID=UPI002DB7C8E9|nr:hypothetical protein [Actinophytocola sp.]HEU5476036.1 hypothetical protein [Actinophytocola sp.]
MQVESDHEGHADHDTPPGDPTAAIEEAVAGLDELDDLPVAEHVARFDAVHVALNVALSTIDRE